MSDYDTYGVEVATRQKQISNNASVIENVQIVEGIINQFPTEKNCKYTVTSCYSMRSFVDNEEKYTLYVLAPCGYAILYNETYGLMEACFEENDLVNYFKDNYIYYYGGPGNYCVWYNNTFSSILTNELIEEKKMHDIANREKIVHANEKSKQNLTRNTTYETQRTTVTYEVHPEYFSELDEHGRSNRMYSLYSSQSEVINMIINRLIAGYPVIASMSTVHGAEYNHSVVIYGATNSTFRVHMGWSSAYNSIYTSSSWFYECGYII